MYPFLGIAISTSSSLLFRILLHNSLECNSIAGFFLNACNFISNFIGNQITRCLCCFLNCYFRCCFYCICCRFFSTVKKFLTVFVTYTFTHVSSKRPYPYTFTCILSVGPIEYLIFITDASFNYHY